jgi:deoxycytidylate deaminase
MKQKHIDIRIEQCLILAQASNCPRRKLAAILLDPTRNVILADAYNGGPRDAPGKLCAGHYCERDGLTMDDLEVAQAAEHRYRRAGGSTTHPTIVVRLRDQPEKVLKRFRPKGFEQLTEPSTVETSPLKEGQEDPLGLAGIKAVVPSTEDRATAWAEEFVAGLPAVESGTRMERGCHHAEMNVICNAAAVGTRTMGAWMICLAEPCMMCAKMIHHAGIAKVILVEGGYAGGRAGVDYLLANGVEVEEVNGPKDPRLEVTEADPAG